MTKDKKQYLISTSIIFFLLLIWMYIQHGNDVEYNKIRCETIPLNLQGVITKVDGRSGYSCIFVNGNKDGISFDISSIKLKKGFGAYHYYAVGDTIYKDANSKEVLIKNGDSMCELILECNN